ncbi:7750_t:CDS:2, partial [Funneliformis mosseae]
MGEHKLPTILIIGADPGGLALAHSIQKNYNMIKNKFNVKIFDCEPSPQGTDVSKINIKMNSRSIATRLHEVVSDPIDGGIENHVLMVKDHLGNIEKIYYSRVLTCNRKKCVRYYENEKGVWVIFEDEIWELSKLRVENDYGKYPFKTFYPLRRRPLRDIYPEN